MILQKKIFENMNLNHIDEDIVNVEYLVKNNEKMVISHYDDISDKKNKKIKRNLIKNMYLTHEQFFLLKKYIDIRLIKLLDMNNIDIKLYRSKFIQEFKHKLLTGVLNMNNLSSILFDLKNKNIKYIDILTNNIEDNTFEKENCVNDDDSENTNY